MNHTTQYLQSVAGQGAIEIATLVNHLLTGQTTLEEIVRVMAMDEG